jgi:hypothetical protein
LLALAVASCGGKIDDDLTGSGRSKATGAPGDSPTAAAPGSPAGSGSTPPANWPACALKSPVRQDFEKGLASGDWGAAPAGLDFDTTNPISGATSLKIDVRRALMYRALMTHPIPASCAVVMRLAIRSSAPLFASGENATIVRLAASPAFFDLVLGENGSLSMIEVTQAQAQATVPGAGGGPGPAPSVGNAHSIGTIAADVTESIVVTLDLSSNEVSGSVSPAGPGAAQGAPTKLTIPHGDLSGVVVGLFAGSAKAGTYWLDDFVLE